jgi:hypothetical protein
VPVLSLKPSISQTLFILGPVILLSYTEVHKTEFLLHWFLIEGCTASYPVGRGGSSMGEKWTVYEADHSPPSSSKVMNDWSYIFTPPLCAYGLHRDNF